MKIINIIKKSHNRTPIPTHLTLHSFSPSIQQSLFAFRMTLQRLRILLRLLLALMWREEHATQVKAKSAAAKTMKSRDTLCSRPFSQGVNFGRKGSSWVLLLLSLSYLFAFFFLNSWFVCWDSWSAECCFLIFSDGYVSVLLSKDSSLSLCL